MSMSVDGLVSGMDTTSIISQLLPGRGRPADALKTKLSATQSAASAYRTVNTTFLGDHRSGRRRSEARPVVDDQGDQFLLERRRQRLGRRAHRFADLHRRQARFRATPWSTATRGTWTASTSSYGASSIEVFDKAGVSKGTISIGGTPDHRRRRSRHQRELARPVRRRRADQPDRGGPAGDLQDHRRRQRVLAHRRRYLRDEHAGPGRPAQHRDGEPVHGVLGDQHLHRGAARDDDHRQQGRHRDPGHRERRRATPTPWPPRSRPWSTRSTPRSTPSRPTRPTRRAAPPHSRATTPSARWAERCSTRSPAPWGPTARRQASASS